MSLFESVENDLSSYFVSQGSIFDSILKTVLERITYVESRADHNHHAVTQLLHDGGFRGSDEMEYYMLTLSRQLNLAITLLFKPHTKDVIVTTQQKQQTQTISDVLQDNEAILMKYETPPPPVSHFRNSLSEKSPAIECNPTQAITTPETSESVVDPSISNQNPSHSAVKLTDNLTTLSKPSSHPKHSVVAMVHSLHFAEELRLQHEHHLHGEIQNMKRQMQHLEGLNEQLREALESSQHVAIDFLNAHHEQQQKEMEKQLLTLTNNILAQQTAQEQQLTRIMDHLREIEGHEYVSKVEGNVLFRKANDRCVFGLDEDMLTTLQRDLIEFKATLAPTLGPNESEPTIVETPLDQELTNALALIQDMKNLRCSHENEFNAFSGAQLMDALRESLSRVENEVHMVINVPTTTPTAFLTHTIRHMERGTASLLQVLEKQQERLQQTLIECQTLQHEFSTQRSMGDELRAQLAACPSQEATLQLINALQAQLQAETSLSNTQMLETVEQLKLRMAGLPTGDVLDQLISSKADRSELESLLANRGPSLSKSQTKCLSCDQTLPFMHPPHTRPTSSSPSRPPSRSVSPRHYTVLETPQEEARHDRDTMQSHETHPLSTEDILRDLASAIASSKRRKQQEQWNDKLESGLDEEGVDPSRGVVDSLRQRRTSMSASSQSRRHSLVGEDKRNRVPLRTQTVSEQVMYGPTIASVGGGATSLRKSSSTTVVSPLSRAALPSQLREIITTTSSPRTVRPKTAFLSERNNGEVILRVPQTSAIIRPFSELPPTSQKRGNNGTFQ